MAMVPLQLRFSPELLALIQYLAEQEQISAAQWIRERLWATVGNEAGLQGLTVEQLQVMARAKRDDDEDDDAAPAPAERREPPHMALGPGLMAVAAPLAYECCGQLSAHHHGVLCHLMALAM